MDLFLLTLRSTSYGQQRSCEGYVFAPVSQSFCSQGEGSASVHAGIPPGTRHSSRTRPPPRDQAPLGPGTPPPGVGTPHPGSRHPPADGYCWGRYTSYWNASLVFSNALVKCTQRIDTSQTISCVQVNKKFVNKMFVNKMDVRRNVATILLDMGVISHMREHCDLSVSRKCPWHCAGRILTSDWSVNCRQ